MQNTRFVAVDDGYAQIKVFGDHPDGVGQKKSVFKSSVRAGRFGLRDLSGAGTTDAYTTDGGEEFTVSPDVSSENTQFDSFHVSAMNRVLVHHGLVSAGYNGLNVALTTGLPVADYFSGDGLNADHIARKRENLMKPVKRAASPDSAGPTIVKVSVGCQAVAAYIDYALDDKLEKRSGIKDNVAIVDIGGRTTDIAVVIKGTAIDHAMSGTENIGVLDVYKTLAASIASKFNIRDVLPTSYLDKAVRTQKIELWGEDEDIRDLVQEALDATNAKIRRAVERKLGQGAQHGAVVFVGGGAALFSDIASTFRNGYLPEDPEFANARGLWKFARLLDLQSVELAANG